VEVELHAFLTSALDGGDWSASRTGRFISRVRTADIHWIGGWVGPRAGLESVAKKVNCFSASARNWSPVVQPVAHSLYWLSYPGALSSVLASILFLHTVDKLWAWMFLCLRLLKLCTLFCDIYIRSWIWLWRRFCLLDSCVPQYAKSRGMWQLWGDGREPLESTEH
jgi:hypothetical protein